MIVDSFPDREITINGTSYLYFGGTAYLGLPSNYEFQKIIAQSVAKWGVFYGSSRNSNVKLSVFNKAELLFAKQINSEYAVTVSSGAIAGKLVIDYLSKSNFGFYHHPKTHPAILFPQSLPLFVDGKLHPNLVNTKSEDIVITVDAILPLEVEPTSFSFLDKISSKKKITLIIDESHSLGILGKYGEGIFSSISNKNLHRKIMISSLGKALGISGGIIASDKKFIETIKNEPVFVSSSSANPAYLETYLLSQELIKLQRKKLKENLDFLFKGLKMAETYLYNIGYPVIYCSEERVFNDLFKQGIIITNFKYPTYKGLMNRIVITANHTQEDLKRLKYLLKNT